MGDRTPSPEGGPSGRETLLDVGVEVDGSSARVTPVGEIDLVTAPKLDETLRAVRSDRNVRWVVVDLAGVTFLDSSGLHALCKTANQARHDGFDFSVAKSPAHIRRLFVLTGIDQVVDMIER